MLRSSRQHYETVQAKRSAACIGHTVQSSEEIFIYGIRATENAPPFFHGYRKSPPLFIRIAQLVECVGQFNAATVQFEAFGNPRIIAGHLSESSLARWISIKNSRLS